MDSRQPRNGPAVRHRLERRALRTGIGLRAFGAVVGVSAMLWLSPDGIGLPAAATVAIVVVNSLAMTATALWGLRRPGRVPTALTAHHVVGDALNMTLIAVTIDPTAQGGAWVLTLVAVGEAGALRGGRAAMATFSAVMVAVGASMATVDGLTSATAGRWAVVVFLAGGPAAVLAAQATLLRDALARSERARDLLHHTALHDELTGLLNRRGLRQSVEDVGAVAAVLFLDLDHFKQVNDSLGHDAGDEVLRRVGQRLRSGVRDQDVVARLAGDEFAVVLTSGGADPSLVAERLRHAICSPIPVRSDLTATVGVSIGIACSEDASPAALLELLDTADTAMYLDKSARRHLLAGPRPHLAATAPHEPG